MKFNEMVKKILYLHNELIFVFDVKSKQIFDVYKGDIKYKDNVSIDEFIDIFRIHFNLQDNFRVKLYKFLINLDPPSDPFELALTYTQSDGSPISIKYMAMPIENNQVLFSLSTNREEMVSSIDDLTKCLTKDIFYEKINESIAAKKEFVLMKIDIDDFSKFNETYGHMFGDMILIEIAGLIKKYILNNGYVARTGGDEFLVLIYSSNDYDTIHELCAKLRNQISSLDGSNCVKNAKFTATVGCALYPKDGDNADLLLKKVDSALIRGKGKGKNCFIIYNPDKCGPVTLEDNIKVKEIKMDEYNSSISNYNIIYGIIEVLNRRSYIKINFLDSLSLIGNYFMLDRISLIVLNPENGNIDDQIIWNNPLYLEVPLITSALNIPNWRKEYDKLNMIKINQVESNKDLAIYEQLKKEKTSSIIAFELIHEDKVYGQVRFDMIHENRFWQPKNVSALSLISKMYAIKLAAEYTNVKHYNELYIDKLTGLKNYSRWIIDVHDYVLTNKQPYSVIMFEICNFQSLISTVGSKECDKIILKISEWLKSLSDDLTCRVRGEIFAIFTNNTDEELINERAKEFYKKVTSTNYTSNISSIRIKSGMYISHNVDSVDVSLERTFLALNSSSDNELLLYTDKLYDDIKEQTALEFHIEEALENNEFMLFIQPKISTKTGKIGGAEALTRWNYNFEKILQPYKFIPLFERTGYITKLDYNVFENVCRFLREVLDSGKNPVPISVNVSRYTMDYDNYIDTINSIRKKYNIPIELIELEITEGMYTENMDDIKEFVDKLRKEGYTISIDDFGSGYSNLNNIANLDFEIIKLDKSLCNMATKRKEIILSAIISIAKKTGHIIVCEGVEDKEMYEKLSKLGADLIQGYYFDKPLEKEEFRKKYIN